jgi:cation transporter-like permease
VATTVRLRHRAESTRCESEDLTERPGILRGCLAGLAALGIVLVVLGLTIGHLFGGDPLPVGQLIALAGFVIVVVALIAIAFEFARYARRYDD